MANHISSKKRIRQTIRKTKINTKRKSKLKTAIKSLVTALDKKLDKEQLTPLFRKAESQLMKSVSKGILKKNTAARKISRLSAQVKKVSA